MTVTIHVVLDRLRAEALDERDKGSASERLIRAYLTTGPLLGEDRQGLAAAPGSAAPDSLDRLAGTYREVAAVL